ncbi:tumor necrosis factor receptor superfamily member 17 [Ornithorhynchus anatinus]|uniref:TNF receptor superfamily member 17 n=1 Tax=Ornithorhynchus anatinus TaxID=9258 RepID=A0A6I8NCP4_ORNAN|nr:tumor necrosis factor receptor superfamily member 17 [Ornithorhynchus anatinus]
MIQMVQQCFKNEYFDNLLQACKPCHLRCPKSPPLVCQSYCAASATASVKITDEILWICLGMGAVLSLTVFVLTFLFKKMSQEQTKEELKNTGESGVESQDPAKAAVPNGAKEDEASVPLRAGTATKVTVEECTCEECNSGNPKEASQTSFPLPATQEGATVLVTTKTNDCYKGGPGPGSDTFSGIWESALLHHQ